MTIIRPRSVMFSRRSFVEKVGLGMGAALLAPLAKNLVTEAQGQAVDRKIAMFWFVANGINPYWLFTPPEFQEVGVDVSSQDPATPTSAVMNGRNFTLPAAFQPFVPFQDRVLMIDGLKNNPGSDGDGGHSMGFMALSCVFGQEIPAAITFDQALAKTISAGTPRRSLVIGQAHPGAAPGDFTSRLFAEAKDKSVPAFQNPRAFFTDLFGTGMAQASGMMPGGNAKKGRVLFDALKHDIGRLQGAFAGEEKAKLDSYLKVLEDHERSIQLTSSLNCTGGTPPADPAQREPVVAVEALHAIASVALVCGMSNVMCVDIGCGESHDYMPDLRMLFEDNTRFGNDAARLKGLLEKGSGFGGIGHDPREIGAEVLGALHLWMTRMMAKTLNDLKAANLYDNSVSMFTSDNGETHHSPCNRWPVMLVGNAGGKLKADNRYLRYPGTTRALEDMYRSIGTAFGAPLEGFGVGPVQQHQKDITKGPLAELL